MNRLHIFSRMVAVLLTVSALGACQWMTEDYADDDMMMPADNGAKRFINLSICVNTGNAPTRAGELPAGGENGDGREAGFNRENEVKGITLFFYQAAEGINAADNTAIDHVVYYPVSPTTVKRDPAGTTEADLNNGTRPGNTPDEYVFTTGNQLLDKAINPSTAYSVIAVLNADLTGVSGLTTLGAVRNYTFARLYASVEGSNDPEDFTDFVMTSEQDFTMKLDDADDWTKTSTAEADYYEAKKFIRVERLAARIDFWAAGSNGYKTSADNAAYTAPGYEYNVTKTDNSDSGDRFVVTGVMPFNLNSGNGTNGGEYLIKRLVPTMEDGAAISYLADETTTNYVLDPATKTKADGTLTYYQNTLSNLIPTGENKTLVDVTSLASNSYYRSVSDAHSAVRAASNSAGFENLEDGTLTGEDIIVGYPMENTLWSASLLFNYATGLAIEGDYYIGGTGTPEHRIYYGYLRHQGTATSYNAMLPAAMSETATSTGSGIMEYSIVRNNIYRVYISKITKDVNEELYVKLLIKVKKWDKFVHTPIYM